MLVGMMLPIVVDNFFKCGNSDKWSFSSAVYFRIHTIGATISFSSDSSISFIGALYFDKKATKSLRGGFFGKGIQINHSLCSLDFEPERFNRLGLVYSNRWKIEQQNCAFEIRDPIFWYAWSNFECTPSRPKNSQLDSNQFCLRRDQSDMHTISKIYNKVFPRGETLVREYSSLSNYSAS